MTDKWVSLERYYCKYCNTWCGGDKMSIKHHEGGVRHKMSVQKYLHESQKKMEEEKRQKTDMRVQLAALEREANKSYRNDIAMAQQHYSESLLAANPAAYYQTMQTGAYGNQYYQYQMGAYNPAGQPEEPPAPSPRLLEARKLREFYESKGIKIPQEVLDTIKEEESLQPEPEPVPEPAAPEPAVPTNFTSFQDFYKQFYQQYQKQQSGNTQEASDGDVKKEEVAAKGEAVKEEIAIKEEDPVPEHIPVDQEDGHPYGKWVTVVRQEEEAKNAPVTLVEDEFTKNDPYFQRRQNALASQSNLQDSDEETDDRQLSLLEKKDTSARYEEESDEDAPKKPVTFKKKKDRKRKMPMNANQGGVRKRLIVSNVHEDD